MKILKEMTNKELLKLYREYDDLLHGNNPCFGTRDVRFFYQICYEMDKREENK